VPDVTEVTLPELSMEDVEDVATEPVPDLEAIRRSRFRLQNPYAHCEYFEQPEDLPQAA
jgi:hypothetical protein